MAVGGGDAEGVFLKQFIMARSWPTALMSYEGGGPPQHNPTPTTIPPQALAELIKVWTSGGSGAPTRTGIGAWHPWCIRATMGARGQPFC